MYTLKTSALFSINPFQASESRPIVSSEAVSLLLPPPSYMKRCIVWSHLILTSHTIGDQMDKWPLFLKQFVILSQQHV